MNRTRAIIGIVTTCIVVATFYCREGRYGTWRYSMSLPLAILSMALAIVWLLSLLKPPPGKRSQGFEVLTPPPRL